jgi:DNA (cytosine-5)-methyltransferase 1
MAEPTLKVASMFAGCGGLDYAFHMQPDIYNVVYVNDFDMDACNTYEKNYNFKPECNDIAKIENIPDCDILTGGFPCQGFSVANQNRLETDNRNKLYLELVRLLRLKKPKYFIFENVKGILSLGKYETDEDKKNHKGSVFKMIVSDLENCGYNVHTKLFKLKWYDIPQNRERVIFIGVRNDISERIHFDWPTETKEITKTLKDAIGDLPIDYDEELQHVGSKQKVYINGYMGNRKLDWDKIAPTITGRGGGTGGPCINVHPSGERRMTIREYARIQTFPDTFKFEGSKSSMYRQIGNAVPPKFSYILSKIIHNLNKQL